MSWYNYKDMKCQECGYEYEQDNSTLSFYDPGHKQCPKCNGKVTQINDTRFDKQNKLIFKKKRFDYVCELTEDMDKYIKFENPTIFNTYIYNSKIDKYWLIRFPGATRGRITVNQNEIITNIEIYKDENNIYKSETEDILKKKYIGMKIEISE